MKYVYFGSLRTGTRSSTHTKDALHGAQWDQRQLIVKDGRRDAGLTLDRSGFEMVPGVCCHQAWSMPSSMPRTTDKIF